MRRFVPLQISCTAKQRAWDSLFDHLVGNGEHPGREGETKRLRSLEIDHKLKLGRLHYRQVSGFGAPRIFPVYTPTW